MLWEHLWVFVPGTGPTAWFKQDQMPSFLHDSGEYCLSKKGKKTPKTCWKEILLTVRLQKKSKAICTDVYVPLICNAVYYISFLGLEHQVRELTYVFVHWFIHNHNQQNGKEIHRIT